MKEILIIEDDVRIAAAHDALSGVQAAVRCQPDLVRLDIALPAGDGFTTAERIRNVLPRPIPFIFITGRKEPGLRARAEQMGAAAFLEKPYDPQALLSIVQRALATIFITAGKQKGLRETARQLGAAGFLEKPYDPGELLATVAHALQIASSYSTRNARDTAKNRHKPSVYVNSEDPLSYRQSSCKLCP